MKTIVIPAVMLFGLLLAATIGASTVAATKPDWTVKQDAQVITPPIEAPPLHTNGTVKNEVNVPERAIDRSPALVGLGDILPD
jgi:hypothetical protein